jgi:hypothetical protein
MGNRAVITTKNKDMGIYLHWNGGRDSVEAFLKYADLQGFRRPEGDCYGWARLAQVIANTFKSGLSVGVDRYERLDTDNWDNGVYIIEDWKIVGREFKRNPEQKNYDLWDSLEEINDCQPEYMKLDLEKLKEKENEAKKVFGIQYPDCGVWINGNGDYICDVGSQKAKDLKLEEKNVTAPLF